MKFVLDDQVYIRDYIIDRMIIEFEKLFQFFI